MNYHEALNEMAFAPLRGMIDWAHVAPIEQEPFFAIQWAHMDYPLMFRHIDYLEDTKELIDSGWMGFGHNAIAIWKVKRLK